MAPQPESLGAHLLASMDDDSINDITLVGNDGKETPANRAIMAIRSQVLKAMLYGSFREGSSTAVNLTDYNSKVIRAAVEFCYSDDITLEEMLEKTEEAVRQLVSLCRFAEFYCMPLLRSKAGKLRDSAIESNPELASVVFVEVTNRPLEFDDWRSAAWSMILKTPRVFFELLSSRETVGLLEYRDVEALVKETISLGYDYRIRKRAWLEAMEEQRKKVKADSDHAE